MLRSRHESASPRAVHATYQAHSALRRISPARPVSTASNRRTCASNPTAKLDVRQLALSLFFEEAAPETAPPSQSATPDAPGGERSRQVVLAGEPTCYQLRRARRRTIGFQIDDRGLTVSAPRWVSLRDIEAALIEKERWIRRKLSQWQDYKARHQLPQIRWACGGSLPYLGSTLTLRLRPEAQATALHRPTEANAAVAADAATHSAIAPVELHVALPAQALEAQIRDSVQAWLQGEARRLLGERLALLAARMDAKPAGLSLSSARTQWGSCTHDGRIRLNWRLIHFALPVIDYVVAHELAHLKEMNHGPRFWNTVAELLPGFEEAREQIRGVDLSALG